MDHSAAALVGARKCFCASTASGGAHFLTQFAIPLCQPLQAVDSTAAPCRVSLEHAETPQQATAVRVSHRLTGGES